MLRERERERLGGGGTRVLVVLEGEMMDPVASLWDVYLVGRASHTIAIPV